MNSVDPQEVRELLMSLFQRHFVALRVRVTKGNEVMWETYSAFVMEVAGDWYLVTAGHCIDKVEKMRGLGYSVSAEIFDGLARSSKFNTRIPFDYESSMPISLDEFGADFGVMRISFLYRKQLEANGIMPLDERVWKLRPQKYEPIAFLLLGIPHELTIEQGKVITYYPSIHSLKPLPVRPDFIPEPKVPTFYGTIDLGEDLQSIVGMSGGPIFSIQESNGQIRYWLHALQSSWYRKERIVTAPLAEYLGRILEHAQKLRTTDANSPEDNGSVQPANKEAG
jgi:hypothetical protein